MQKRMIKGWSNMTVLNLDRKGHAEVQLREGIGILSNHRCSGYYIDRLVLWKKSCPSSLEVTKKWMREEAIS